MRAYVTLCVCVCDVTLWCYPVRVALSGANAEVTVGFESLMYPLGKLYTSEDPMVGVWAELLRTPLIRSRTLNVF